MQQSHDVLSKRGEREIQSALSVGWCHMDKNQGSNCNKQKFMQFHAHQNLMVRKKGRDVVTSFENSPKNKYFLLRHKVLQ